ncbi:hypothetical protein NLG97_g8554 [Lecanicillium saksenae]|uniref:Uncharacterized protein n=1 Tax=Lecanicillium saksenae TaxID=468837 RepID=A0ACC1QMF6_9HYPO|nr:hypothetical protein NLG97_g8554 [Lecanicillium saksenae]
MEPKVAPKSSKLLRTITDIKETISIAHLLTESNIKAYMSPVVLFAVLSVASGSVTTITSTTPLQLAVCFLHALVYMWLYVLHFDCSNQKDPESIQEDTLNKPWRAIPSGRLTVQACERWYVAATVLLVLTSAFYFGGLLEAVAFMAETWVYDRVNGGDSWWGKNIIGALFYATGHIGATRVAARSIDTSAVIGSSGYMWCLLLALNTLTTLQLQDLRDTAGDKARGRYTMPIAMGDTLTRWITAALIAMWSFVCPGYWVADSYLTAAFVLPVVVGLVVVLRMLTLRTSKADRMTFQVYALVWLPALYMVPLLSQYKL